MNSIFPEEKEILDTAIELYGKRNQTKKAVEEMAELTWNLCREETDHDLDNMAEEIADVRIMCDQLEIMYGLEKECKNYRERKLKRLAERLKVQNRFFKPLEDL